MIFPFTAIVGQEEMKKALILNVIDSKIGGVLIMGEKGTGKSTAVRALARLLPEIKVVKGCRFNCDPEGQLCTECQELLRKEGELQIEWRKMKVVELPLGVTEDRLVGTLDIEQAIKKGERRFEAGILAEANRNFLYVDEVNLLEDHIVDLLLDSAAMGVNYVEREGISFAHPANFILVGTMNPEEGDLRPQLLDRFGLCVYITAIRDKDLRKEILRRRAEFDMEPEEFLSKWAEEEKKLAEKITRAKENLPQVKITENILETIVEITTSLPLDGHRADIVMLRAARALAAFEGSQQVTKRHLREVAHAAIYHRLKRLPFQEWEEETRKLDEVLSSLEESTV
ncbi:MAG: ATP-binding protein [bacterium]